jgi:D-arabinose 1-dehydrogenase-like Zn-dependent alcohol dehydrogenase
MKSREERPRRDSRLFRGIRLREGSKKLAAEIPIKPEVQEFTLEEANKALVELKERKIRGAKVLRID